MNGNYEISSIAFSLKTLCAVKLAHQVLVASGLKDRCTRTHKSFEIKAMARVAALELPHQLVEMVENLIGPINRELYTWYRKNAKVNLRCYGDPILTPQGILDTVTSVMSILSNDKINAMTRHILACEHCYEDVISEMFTRMELDLDVSENRKIARATPFTSFWSNAFSGRFGELVDGGHLPQHANNVGFKLAFEERNDVAIRYFISKASEEEATSCVYRSNYYDHQIVIGVPNISPATCCLLFSKLSEDQRRDKMAVYAHVLLEALLHWPFQCFFMEALDTVTVHLGEHAHWKIMRQIAKKIAVRSRDYTYGELFTRFWRAGSGYRHHSSPRRNKFHEFIIFVLMLRDKPFIGLIFAEMSAEEKEGHLMNFRENKICAKLIQRKAFSLLELFIRGCCSTRMNVLQKFKSELMAMDNLCMYKMHLVPSLQEESWVEWREEVLQCLKIVDKILARNCDVDAMEEYSVAK